MRSLCLFGGSFDPVHLGHLLVARAALEELCVERVVFIPAAQSPFKTHLQPTPAPLRLRMLRTALAGKPWAMVDEQEVSRGGVSFTIDTLRSYKQRFPAAALHYLIGEDNAPQLPEWRDPQGLAALAEFIVIPRPRTGNDSQQPQTNIEAALRFGFKIRFLKGFPLGVSSSQIRSRVAARLPVEDLVPPGVGEIIANNGLYL